MAGDAGDGSVEALRAGERLYARGRDLDRAGRYRAAERALLAAERSTRDVPGGAAIAARALVDLAAIRAFDGRLRSARRLLAAATARAEAGGLGWADRFRVRVAILRLEADAVDAAGALPRLEALLAEATTSPDATVAEGSLARRATASAARLAGDHARARELLDRDLAALGPAADPLEVADVLNERGMVGKFEGRFREATADLERAGALVRAHAGPDHPDLGAIEHNLGGVAHARGDLAAAERRTGEAVAIHARTLGDDHLATLLDRAALAGILDGLGRTTEAETLVRSVLGRLLRRVGSEHREVAATLNNLGAMAYRMGRPAEAEAAYRRSLAAKRARLGDGAPSVAITLNNLAAACRAQGRTEEAARHYREAIGILERSVAPDHPALATARRNLARLSGSGQSAAAPPP